MKTQTTTFLAQLSNEELSALTTTVTEKLATAFNYPVRTFTVADLWNIQRRKKSIGIRRNLV